MLEESGQVVDLDGDFAWIESERRSTCGSCTARTGCGTGVIAKVLGRKRIRLRAVNRIDAAVGDHVVIGIAESGVVRGSLAVYAVPLATLLGGAIVGQLVGLYLLQTANDLPSIAGAAGGFCGAPGAPGAAGAAGVCGCGGAVAGVPGWAAGGCAAGGWAG